MLTQHYTTKPSNAIGKCISISTSGSALCCNGNYYRKFLSCQISKHFLTKCCNYNWHNFSVASFILFLSINQQPSMLLTSKYIPWKWFSFLFLFISDTLVRLMDTSMILWHFLNTRTFLAIHKLLLMTNTVYRTSIMAGMYSFHSKVCMNADNLQNHHWSVSQVLLSANYVNYVFLRYTYSIFFLNQFKT